MLNPKAKPITQELDIIVNGYALDDGENVYFDYFQNEWLPIVSEEVK